MQPTVTDAHLLRGTLQPDLFLGGRMPLDTEATRRAFAALADRFGSTPEVVADNALKLADASIVRAIQLVSTERGLDPRDFILVPYGGAGPLHAASVATDLGIETIVVPPNPGTMSAFGLLAAPIARYLTHSVQHRLDVTAPAALQQEWDAMREEVNGSLRELGLAQVPQHALALDMRFVGQGFEVSVDVEPTLLEAENAAACIVAVEQAFLATYERMYQQRVPTGRPIEVTAMRVAAMITPASVPRLVEAAQPAARESTRRVLVDGVVAQTRFVPVDVLQLDRPIAGPLVIQSNTSSIVVPEGWTIRRDVHENLIMHRNLP